MTRGEHPLKRSNRLVLLIGIFLAIVAFVLIVLMLGNGGGGDGEPRRSQEPTTGKVVVATKDIDLGAAIQQDQVGLKEIDLTAKPADSYTDPVLVVGQIARQPVTAGQLITSAIINDTGSIKQLDVPAGKVGMSVRVNQVSGVGTVIKAGDYVDAVVAFSIVPTYVDPTTGQPKPAEIGASNSVKALLQGMQVLGTLLPPPTEAEAAPEASGSPAPNGTTTSLSEQDQIVILAVTLQQAEVLNYSQMTAFTTVPNSPYGITLVLRSSKDYVDALGEPSIPPDVATTGVILRILVEQYGVLPPFVVTPPKP
jgi:Flp pilus assembly protein CpaB